MNIMREAIISMGSNIADGYARLDDALSWLRRGVLADMTDSGIYTSEATDGNGLYFNVVVRGNTSLSVEEFESLAKKKERDAGRIPNAAEVVLDIDLVSLGDIIVRPAELCRLYFLQGLNIVATTETKAQDS